MSNNRDNIIDTKTDVINKSSYNINFRFVDATSEAAVASSGSKVYIYEDGTGTVINSRDGTSLTGFTVTDTNLVNFDLSPADLTIVNTTTAAARGYETHRVLFEIVYNSGADKYMREYLIKVLHSPVFVT